MGGTNFLRTHTRIPLVHMARHGVPSLGSLFCLENPQQSTPSFSSPASMSCRLVPLTRGGTAVWRGRTLPLEAFTWNIAWSPSYVMQTKLERHTMSAYYVQPDAKFKSRTHLIRLLAAGPTFRPQVKHYECIETTRANESGCCPSNSRAKRSRDKLADVYEG